MRVALIALLVILAGVVPASGQWVDFTDRTSSRLSLSTISISDADEKDIAVGDLNRDGLTDVVVVRKAPFSNPGARQDVLLMNEN